MRASLPAILADGVGQCAAWLDRDGVIAAVYGERDGRLLGHSAFSKARNAGRGRCGVAGISSICAPKGARASLIALSTAAGAPIVPPSPSPLALVIELTLGVSL